MGNGADAQGARRARGTGWGVGRGPAMALTRSFTSARAASPARTGFARVRRRWPSQGSSLASVPNSAARHASYLPAHGPPALKSASSLPSAALPQLLCPACPFQLFATPLRTAGAGADSHPRRATITTTASFSRPRAGRGIRHRRSAAAGHTACPRQHVLERSSSPPPVTTT